MDQSEAMTGITWRIVRWLNNPFLEQNYYQFLQMRRSDDSGAVRKKLEDYSYLLNENIGKGYSSQVFRGRNDMTDEVVAIKVIDMKKINNEVHKNLLASEIEVLKSLKNSDNILEVYDIYNTKNNTYIITELCDGGDLSKFISSKKCLPQRQAVPLMNQVINGYNNMQTRGIIHRDLKPANIFIKSNEVKIADFGFAMKHTDCRKYSSYNVGSPVYMPPEALNENKYSFKSDIWALGVIYYEMLTGKTPWRAKSQKQLARLLTSVPIRKLLPPSISNASEVFLVRTLAVDINERMSPQEIQRFTLNNDKVSVGRQLYSTENSIFDGKNNHIRRGERQQQTSLNKNSITNTNNFKKLALLQTNQDFKMNKFTLPKTAATVTSNKTQQYIPQPNKTINQPLPLALTQKEISHPLRQAGCLPVPESAYDRKLLAKQLLSQIHLCRFMYKLIMRMGDRLSEQRNDELTNLKDSLTGMIFEKLSEVEQLDSVSPKLVTDFRDSSDYTKINQIIQQYLAKYRKDLSCFNQVRLSLGALKQQLGRSILKLYEAVQEEHEEPQEWKQEVIVLDYLVTLRQLIAILQNNDLEGFHNKSKIQTIVEGSPSKTITQEHLNAIRSKLRAIKII